MLIFVATYNEHENVARMCSELLALGLNADLLFLDDNSPDGTGEILDRLAREHAGPVQVQVIHRSGKLGIGSAHLDGIAWAYDRGYETLVTMDCDFTHSPSDVRRLLAEFPGHDVTVGSRFLRQGSLPGWNVLRRSLTWLGHFLTRRLLGIRYDATGAFRVYRLTTIPRGLFRAITARGYSFFFESLFVIDRNGFAINEVPIVLPPRTYGHSKMSFRQAAHSAAHVLSLYAVSKVNPAQFRGTGPAVEIDPRLPEVADWDAYWDRKKTSGSLVYELVATIYRKLVIRRRLNAAIRRRFAAGSSLLHAGCGSGQVDVDLQRSMKITALDISPSALQLYRQHNPDAHEVRHGSILSLPFAEGSFDGVYNLGVMEHFPDGQIRAALAEFRRVLKPGGQVVLFWPHRRATSVAVLRFVHWLANDVFKKNMHLHPPEVSLLGSKTQAAALVASAGLELVRYSFGPGDGLVQAMVVAAKPGETGRARSG